MSSPKRLYHFLSPDMGYSISEYLSKNSFFEQIEIILIFSTTAFFPKRSFFNPYKLLDYYRYKNEKRNILRIFQNIDATILFIDDVNSANFHQHLSEKSIGLSTGFNQIFHQNTIDKFSNLTNLHPSLLPFYQGPTPIEWCLKNGENYSGWTLHHINNKIDQGEIIYQSVLTIKNKDAKSIMIELTKDANPIISNYLESQFSKGVFRRKMVDPQEYYIEKVGYKSFIK